MMIENQVTFPYPHHCPLESRYGTDLLMGVISNDFSKPVRDSGENSGNDFT